MNKYNDVISIIVPVYNVEKYLKKCVDSLLNQSYPNLEIILVNDGSTDASGIICEDYSNHDNRIVYIYKPNGGLSSARNVGLEVAKGEYVVFIDSDDYVATNMIEKLYIALSVNSADMSICDFQKVDEQYNNIGDVRILKSEVIEKPNILKVLCRYDDCYAQYVIACNKLYRRQLFDNIRYIENRIHEDEFIIHHILSQCKKIVIVSDKLYFYLQRNNSITHKAYTVKRLDAVDAMLDRYYFFQGMNLKVYTKLIIRQAYGILYDYLSRIDNSIFKSSNKDIMKQVIRLLLKEKDLRGIKLLLLYLKMNISSLNN